jgi:thioester reductase-like protein
MGPGMGRDSRILITGVTGLIGGEILRRLNGRGHEGWVWCLVRPKPARGAGQRLRDRLARSGEAGALHGNVRAVPGDVLERDWGLEPGDLRDVIQRVDLIIHNAADTSFAPERDTAATNVRGVQHLIDLARRCRRAPLIVYMSTASNVGRVTGRCLGEDDGCRPDNAHYNGYTRSKAIAEALLRASGLPVLIVRPTIVLSAGLPDAHFARQILWCVPLTRIFRALPIDPAARLDLVDVAFVAEATL